MNDLGLDLDLRLVRYFTVVAEHLSFSKAAEELHLAQPSLSRQIQRLEQRLNVRLLERTPHGNHLTEAGRAFLPEAQAVLRAARRAAVTARAHSPVGQLTIGYVDDLIITPAVREVRTRRPSALIQTRHLTCQDLTSLEDAEVDVLVARAPLLFSTEDVWTKVLYTETRILVVPVEHPLAQRTSISLSELDDQQPYPCAIAEGLPANGWTAYRLLGRDPLSPALAPQTYEDKLELVAGGQAIGIQPAGDRRTLLHPGVATVALNDAPDSDVVLVGRVSDRNPLVEEFWKAATTHLTPVPA
jgi:DNA-binding transcriptional LysR family regulator